MDIYAVLNQMKIERKRLEDIQLRVTYYARVSTLKDEQTTSIESQIAHFQQMIQNNPNWELVPGYVDRVRGETADNRMSFKQMIADGYNGKFDLVLTKEVSRFARNTIDSLTYTRELLKHGVGVFFLTDNICTVDQDSELRLTIMASIAQDEVRKLSERIKFGHRKAIEKGHVLGNSRIFGYNLVNNKLVIDESEAEMVRLVFETYATGAYGLKYIETLLWEKGYRNRNGKKIHHNTLSGIISNPKYKGYFCGGRVKVIDYRTKEQKFLPPEEWVLFKDETGNTVPAIVSEELWETANAVLKERSDKVKSADRSAKKTSPLSGKIICGVHNEPFWRSSYSHAIHQYNSVYQWICRKKKREGYSQCKTIPIYEKELYRILGSIILSITKEDIETYVSEFVDLYNSCVSPDNRKVDISSLQEQINRLENKKNKLIDLYAEDIISKQEFKIKNDEINEQMFDLKKEISNKQKEIQPRVDIQSHLMKIRESLLELIEDKKDYTLDTISQDYIDSICNILLDKILVFPVDKNTLKLEIHLQFGEKKSVDYHKRIQRLGHMSNNMIPKQRIGNQFYTTSPINHNIEIPSFKYRFQETRKSLRNQPEFKVTYIVTLNF